MLQWHYERNVEENRSFRKAIFAFSNDCCMRNTICNMRHNTDISCCIRRNIEKRNDGVNRDCMAYFSADTARNGKRDCDTLRTLDTQNAIQARQDNEVSTAPIDGANEERHCNDKMGNPLKKVETQERDDLMEI